MGPWECGPRGPLGPEGLDFGGELASGEAQASKIALHLYSAMILFDLVGLDGIGWACSLILGPRIYLRPSRFVFPISVGEWVSSDLAIIGYRSLCQILWSGHSMTARWLLRPLGQKPQATYRQGQMYDWNGERKHGLFLWAPITAALAHTSGPGMALRRATCGICIVAKGAGGS